MRRWCGPRGLRGNRPGAGQVGGVLKFATLCVSYLLAALYVSDPRGVDPGAVGVGGKEKLGCQEEV